MAFISKETPTGTVNGINKTFTTVYDIYAVDDLFVDGAIYTDFTYNNKTLTLTDAPTTSIVIDYYVDTTTFLADSNKITAAQARTMFEEMFNDSMPDVSDALFYRWLNFINRTSYRNFINIDPERYMSEYSISVLVDTNYYDLPADFKNIQPFSAGLYTVDDQGNITDTRLPETSVGSSTRGFYLGNRKVYVTPIPKDTETLILRYIPKLGTITEDDDSMVLDKEYEEFLQHAIDKFFYYWDRDNNSEVFADQRYSRALDELLEDFSQKPSVASLPELSLY